MKYYDKINNRLVFEEKKATSDFWDSHWKTENFKKIIENGKYDRFVSKITKKFISPNKNHRILEGGCGRGNFVFSLNYHEYDVVGVDYAEKTIREIKMACPELNVQLGDVRDLKFPNEYFDGYWSLGVIEHFYSDYDQIANEMYRVIKKNGYLFITFPYMSPLRKLKSKFKKYPTFNQKTFSEDQFYQFAFDKDHVIDYFTKLGFELKVSKPLDGIKGLKDEIVFFKPILQKIYNSQNFFLKALGFLISEISSPFSGHSTLLIFIKK